MLAQTPKAVFQSRDTKTIGPELLRLAHSPVTCKTSVCKCVHVLEKQQHKMPSEIKTSLFESCHLLWYLCLMCMRLRKRDFVLKRRPCSAVCYMNVCCSSRMCVAPSAKAHLTLWGTCQPHTAC